MVDYLAALRDLGLVYPLFSPARVQSNMEGMDPNRDVR